MVTPYTQPVDNFVNLVAAKLHLKVENTADDDLIKNIIKAACDWARLYEGQSYMIASYKKYLNGFDDIIALPFPPLISVDSVQYIDTAGVTQTLSTDYYTVDTDSLPGCLYLSYNYSWPATRAVPKSVIVTYTGGYSTTFTSAFATDTITVGNSVFSDGDRVRLTTDSADLPAGLSVDTDYYARDVSGSTLKLAATSDGDAITLTDDGTGTHYIGFANRGNVPDRVICAAKLIMTHLYENRAEISDFKLNQVPFAAENLLMERVW